MSGNRETLGGVGAGTKHISSMLIEKISGYLSFLGESGIRKHLNPEEQKNMRDALVQNRDTPLSVFGPDGQPLQDDTGKPLRISPKEEFRNDFLQKYGIPKDAFSGTTLVSLVCGYVYQVKLDQLEKGKNRSPALNVTGMLAKLGLKSLESFGVPEYYGFYEGFLKQYTISLNDLDEYEKMLLDKAINNSRIATPLLTKEQFLEKLTFPKEGGYVAQVLMGKKELGFQNIPSYEQYAGKILSFSDLENLCKALVQEGYLQPYDGIQALELDQRIRTQGTKTIESVYLQSLLNGLVKEGFLKE